MCCDSFTEPKSEEWSAVSQESTSKWCVDLDV